MLLKSNIVSVIVPTYNEGENLAETLERLSKVQDEMVDLEIIVVDDGSSDDTSIRVARFPNVRYIKHGVNRGKGAALNTGIENAQGSIVVVQDADLEYFPENIPELVRPIMKKEVDVVYGNRFKKGVPEGMSLSHYIGNRVLSLVFSLIYGAVVTDVMTGYKAFKRRVLTCFEVEKKGFAIEVELTAKTLGNGFRLKEIPLGYRYRKSGVSKIRYTDGFGSLVQIISGRVRQSNDLSDKHKDHKQSDAE